MRKKREVDFNELENNPSDPSAKGGWPTSPQPRGGALHDSTFWLGHL